MKYAYPILEDKRLRKEEERFIAEENRRQSLKKTYERLNAEEIVFNNDWDSVVANVSVIVIKKRGKQC